MQKTILNWEQIDRLVDQLVEKLPQNYDGMLVITRGGMVPGCLISERTDMRNILVAAMMFYTGIGETLLKPIFLQFPADTILANKRILVVDDIWDSGKTMMAVKERLIAAGATFEIAVIHYKPLKSKFKDTPDYYAAETDDWIVYPWAPKEGFE